MFFSITSDPLSPFSCLSYFLFLWALLFYFRSKFYSVVSLLHPLLAAPCAPATFLLLQYCAVGAPHILLIPRSEFPSPNISRNLTIDYQQSSILLLPDLLPLILRRFLPLVATVSLMWAGLSQDLLDLDQTLSSPRARESFV